MKLPSLEPALRRYSTAVWNTHPRAHRAHIDPSAPREPRGDITTFSADIRIAARIVDVCLGANVGILEKTLGEGLTARYDPLERLARYFPVQEWERELGRDQVREAIFLAVDEAAGLTEIEARVMRLRMDGVTESVVANVIERTLRHTERLVASVKEKLVDLGIDVVWEAAKPKLVIADLDNTYDEWDNG